ncbi:unnamed protein product [Rangifer tarandus platyrhynchus]|uniref:Collagen alpha-1(I) chain-like n=1 Tax=Rangifer tarandus platyrhynchus TaxID=3082113 RepID=A0ABN8ZGY2_RANTA|nr:unnamed protein product [Rangifer tarandus platyrhynchus]
MGACAHRWPQGMQSRRRLPSALHQQTEVNKRKKVSSRRWSTGSSGGAEKGPRPRAPPAGTTGRTPARPAGRTEGRAGGRRCGRAGGLAGGRGKALGPRLGRASMQRAAPSRPLAPGGPAPRRREAGGGRGGQRGVSPRVAVPRSSARRAQLRAAGCPVSGVRCRRAGRRAAAQTAGRGRGEGRAGPRGARASSGPGPSGGAPGCGAGRERLGVAGGEGGAPGAPGAGGRSPIPSRGLRVRWAAARGRGGRAAPRKAGSDGGRRQSRGDLPPP